MSTTEFVQELHSSQKQLENVRNALDQASIVAVTDRSGTIIYVNDKFCQISGYSRDELLGENHNIINSQKHPYSFFKDMWRAIGNGRVWRGEICNRAKNGELYWVDTTIVPFLDDNGKPEQYVSIRTDVTERKRAESELAQTREQLTVQTLFAERLSALAALAGGIAHELHQPLSGIRVYAEALREMAQEGRVDPQQIERTMEKITTQVDRAATVIQHMREFASEDAGDTPEVLDLSAVVHGVFDLIGEQLKAHSIDLVQEIEPDLRVSANRIRLEQVLINLFSNAKDSMMECGERNGHQLTVRGYAEAGEVVLSIADTGGGIPAHIRAKIFEPFVTSKGPDRGTGLGLSICHGILRDYNAQISLHATSDGGAEFHIKFPKVS